MPRGSLSKKSKKDPPKQREVEIMDAATDIMNTKGYSAMSLDEVADAVGMLKGSLYYYIDSKEDLLARVVEEVHAEVEALISLIANDVEATPLERLASYVKAQIDYNSKNRKRIRVYHHDYNQLDEKVLTPVRRRRRNVENQLIQLIVEAKGNGELPVDLNERLAAKVVFASVIWMYTWFRPGAGVTGKEYGDFCADFILAGLHGGSS